MKTRVINVGVNEYVPQVWVPHFLWGGHWEGINKDEEGNLWRFQSDQAQLARCIVSSCEEAEDILFQFTVRQQKKEKLK